jgi:hypothetical protein
MSAFSANIGTPSDFYKYSNTRNKWELYIRPNFWKGPFGRLVAAPQRKAKRQKTSIFQPAQILAQDLDLTTHNRFNTRILSHSHTHVARPTTL